jgi:hypothetical protein
MMQGAGIAVTKYAQVKITMLPVSPLSLKRMIIKISTSIP